MRASAAEFEDFSTNLCKERKIEKPFPVITEVSLRAISGLHAVRANQLIGGGIVDH